MAAPPDITSKSLAVAACIFLVLFLAVSAYFVSTTKSAINDADFSVSQALANGEPISMTLLLFGGIAALSCLLVHRGHPRTHVLPNIATGALLVALMYVPVAHDATVHYTLAGLALALIYASVLLDIHLVRAGHARVTYVVYTLAASVVCTAIIATFTYTVAVAQLLYTLELLTVAVKLASTVTLGFAHAGV